MKNLKTLLIVAATVAATGSAFAASHVGAPMGMSDAKKESTSGGHDAAGSKKDNVARPADAHKDAAAAKAESKKDGAAAATDLTKGEVRKVDLESKKITIKHGAIKNLDMPGMTMVFEAKDAAMLDKLKVGDKISFAAEKSGEKLVVTEIKPAK